MRRFLVALTVLAFAGCDSATPGVNKGKDMPVPPGKSQPKKEAPAKTSE